MNTLFIKNAPVSSSHFWVRMKSKILILLLLALCAVYPQRLYKISAQLGEKKSDISYLVRNGLDYVSSKELSALLGGNIFFNSETAKLESNFDNYLLKVIARSQFIVLTKKPDGAPKSFQIPLSTLLIKDDVFVPLIYMIEYYNLVSGFQLTYESLAKNLVIEKAEDSGEQNTDTTESVIKKSSAVSSKKYDVYDIVIDEKANGTLITLKTNKALRIPKSSINNNVLYVFLSNSSVLPKLASRAKPTGLVSKVNQKFISAKNVQLEFTLKEGYSKTETFLDPETNFLMITIHNKMFVKPEEENADKSKWNFDCVVIDAGHGGKDPGTIGVTGVREKDINLAVALKLGKLIENNLDGVRAVYTRKTDEFVELYKRGKIANEAGGKLFISIHCNSTETKDNNHRGFEVYLLRPGRTKEAIRIAEVENSVIKYEENPDRYEKLTDENFILVSMAHSQFMRYSESFSDFLNQSWKKRVAIPSLGIKQAGFYVLVGASMPSVLIENGFLSNRKDEAYLVSKEGQNAAAEAIFSSIKQYKEFYEREIGN
ncbi:MAG: N-acetylmuramoyl-L-alanine amidase [Ignavibacteria bacterium]|nr:MAG: N-acetylmuramoyl-L-alanine amidase [Ignavibacteria bacterium]KAF0157177.1 MAG: N-acetylmuramoyl-L-alanine amidase [Ignavibacteria bacterium]